MGFKIAVLYRRMLSGAYDAEVVKEDEWYWVYLDHKLKWNNSLKLRKPAVVLPPIKYI
jgi:hypothetical protein